MDANEALERRIDELCRENERLRQEIKTLERECEYIEHMYQSTRSILRNVVRTICATCPDKVLMRVVETCAASASMPQTTLLLARNLYAKWSTIVAEVALYDKMQHGTQTVALQAPYLR